MELKSIGIDKAPVWQLYALKAIRPQTKMLPNSRRLKMKNSAGDSSTKRNRYLTNHKGLVSELIHATRRCPILSSWTGDFMNPKRLIVTVKRI